MGATALGGATSAAGSIMGGQSQAAMYQYQSGVALMNQQIAKQNADYAVYSGEVEAQRQGIKTREEIGQTIAQQGAGNLAVGSGSNARVVESERRVGAQDAALIRSDAAKRAYGYEVEALKYGAESTLDLMAGEKSKTAGYIGAASSLLGAAGSVSSKWLQASSVGLVGGKSGGLLPGDPSG
jgi:hypothetical protein